MKYIISGIISVLVGLPFGFFISMFTASYFVFLEDYGIEILGREFPSEGYIIFWCLICASIIFLLQTFLK